MQQSQSIAFGTVHLRQCSTSLKVEAIGIHTKSNVNKDRGYNEKGTVRMERISRWISSGLSLGSRAMGAPSPLPRNNQAQPQKMCTWSRAGGTAHSEERQIMALELDDLLDCSDRNSIMWTAKSCSWDSPAGKIREVKRSECHLSERNCQGTRAANMAQQWKKMTRRWVRWDF